MRPATFFLTFSTMLALSLLNSPAIADNNVLRSITVNGSGESQAASDIATMSIGVETEAATPALAMSANAERMTDVMTRLKDEGVAEKDLQTRQLAIFPIQANRNQPREIVAYRVTNQLTVTIRDLQRLGVILDQAVMEGANQVNGPNFALTDPGPLLDAARDAAIADAIAKAERYAAAANLALGRVLSIDETGGREPFPRHARAEAMAVSTPIALGEQTITASVTMRFEID